MADCSSGVVPPAAEGRTGGHGGIPERGVEAEILAVLRAETAAFFRGDFEGFARHWVHGTEVRRVTSGPNIRTRISRGWAEMSARIREGMRRSPQTFDADDYLRWDNIQVQAGTDMAWVAHDVVAIRDAKGIASSNFQHETKILHRVDGEWKLVFISIVVPGIERNDVPRIELGGDERICHINMLAREKLKDHPGLVVSADRVRARNRGFDSVLQKEIERAASRLETTLALGSMSREVEAVALGEDDFGHPVFCWISVEQQRVLITFDDAYLIGTRIETASEIYALSPAQQRLARLLATGTELTAAADHLDVSVNTVRTQLRRMFEKTGTNTRTALISTLLSVQPPR